MASKSAVVIPAASLFAELVAAENGVLVAAVVVPAVAPAASKIVVPVAAESGVRVAIPVIPDTTSWDNCSWRILLMHLLCCLLWYLHLLCCFM